MRLVILILLTIQYFDTTAQENHGLDISAINEHLYVFTTYHTYNGEKISANGCYLLNDEGAIMVDTPWDPHQYQVLLDSIFIKHSKKVTAVYATHWHDDRAGGFNYYNKISLPTYATPMTNQLLHANDKDISKNTIVLDSIYRIGGQEFVFHYPGIGHSTDNIVVWFPQHSALHGGCFIKSGDAKNIGFVGDGDVLEWKPSLTRLLSKYPEVKIVIPGHDDWKSEGHINNTFKLLNIE